MSTQRAVVVGAGLGGLRAAEGLRAAGYAGGLVVVGDEPHTPYNRPPLSKDALAGEVAHDRLEFRRRPSVDDVVWRLGKPVIAVDVDGRTVQVGADTLAWDALVLATGVSARRLPVPGPPPAASAGRYVVRTLEDATALRESLHPRTRVVVLGAGFIGCEVAATAIGLGATVTSVALDPLPMLRPLGPALAAELKRRHEERGVVFHLGVGVAAIRGEEHVTGVVLADDTELEADVVVEALGSRCNVDLLEGQGFDLRDGVLADTALRPLRDGAPVDGVAVVGDIARFPYLRFADEPQRVEHWSVPTDTGRRAGAVLAAYLSGEGYAEAAGAPFDPMPSFWSDQFDIRMQSFGMPGLADADGVRLLEGDLEDECIVGYHRGDDLVGVVGIGMLRQLTTYRSRLGRAPS